MDAVPNHWIAEHSHCIDQRDFEMPPAWASRTPVAAPPDPELGDRVHRSGRGRAVARRLADLIGSANRMAVVSSFLLADDDIERAMLEAAQRGVRVYLLLASEARLGEEPGDGEFDQRVHAEHKALLRRLAGRILIRSAPHFHAKYVLVDPFDAPAGVLLTANLTREALERNEELAVQLDAEQVRAAAELSRWAMWEEAEHEMLDGQMFRRAAPLDCVAHPDPVPRLPATTGQAAQLADAARDLIESARQEILVASFGWAPEHPVVEYLCKRVRDGLKAVVLARMRPRAMPALLALAEAGAEVLGFKWLHAKALWADSGKALVMSANLESHGLDQGFELGVPLGSPGAGEVRTRLLQWAAHARFELLPRPILGKLHGETRVWESGQFVDLNVEPLARIDLRTRNAKSADDLALTPDLPKADGFKHPAHELACHWQVRAPTLHRRAKEVLRPADARRERGAKPESFRPPLFKEPGGRLVVAIRSPAELGEAKQTAQEAGAAAIVVDRRGTK